MFENNSGSVRVLVFDCRGDRHLRLDDVLDLQNSVQTPFGHTFRQLLAQWPGRFEWDVTLNAMPKLTVKWDSVFRGVGVSNIFLDTDPAALAILLGGADRRGEDAIVASLADRLARYPGNTLRPAFDEIRDEERRPLLAVLRFKAIDDDSKFSAVNGIVRSLALAVFPAPPGSAIPIERPAIA